MILKSAMHLMSTSMMPNSASLSATHLTSIRIMPNSVKLLTALETMHQKYGQQIAKT